LVEIRLLQAIRHGQTFYSSNKTSWIAVWATKVTNGSPIQSNEEVGMAVHEKLNSVEAAIIHDEKLFLL
jgi:hypothetical protein